jgi:hypothetical protein
MRFSVTGILKSLFFGAGCIPSTTASILSP